MNPKLRFAVTIDTEEDNWLPTRTDIRVENIDRLLEHHRFLRSLDLRPTYFVDYPVATLPRSRAVIGELAGDSTCEIGGHLHPWNTPPLDEALAPRHSMMKNLPAPLQSAKLSTLRTALEQATGQRVRSFRAGRFGLGKSSLGPLLENGFDVDSSVTPDVDWRGFDDGPDGYGAPRSLYALDADAEPCVPSPGGRLTEVPVTVGFTRPGFTWKSKLHRVVTHPTLRPFRLAGILATAGVVRRVIGSPEVSSLADLVACSRACIREGASYLLLFWHSPTLVPGLTPFVKSESDRQDFLGRIGGLVDALSRDFDLVPATTAEIAESFRSSTGGMCASGRRP